MTPEIGNIGAAIVKGVCNPEAKDLAVDLGEFELGALLDEGVLKEVPIIKMIIASRKTWTAIHDQLFLRKVVGFLMTCPRFTDAEKEAFIREHLDDVQKAKKLGDTIVLILDRFDDLEKPEMLAKFFAVFVRGKINLETFRRLAAATDIGFLEDLKTFAQISNFADERLKPLYSNLVRTGLVSLEGPNVPGEGGMAKIRYEVNGLGQLFKKCINEPSAQT